MLPNFTTISVIVFAVGVGALWDPCSAIAEPAPPKIVTAPQRGKDIPPLTQSDLAAIDATREHVRKHWRPADTTDPKELVVTIRLSLNPDGTLASAPIVLTPGTTARFLRAREDAVRAIFRAVPFTMLLPADYELWHRIDITFDPADAAAR